MQVIVSLSSVSHSSKLLKMGTKKEILGALIYNQLVGSTGDNVGFAIGLWRCVCGRGQSCGTEPFICGV